MLTGDMMFAAIRLHPSESKFSTEIAEYADERKNLEARGSNVTVPVILARKQLEIVEDSGASLLLWGLTLGVVGDFVDMLPPYDILQTWIYPTFTLVDVRFWLWLLSYNFRRRKEHEISSNSEKNTIAMPKEKELLVHFNDEQRYFGRVRADARGLRNKSAASLLPGYIHYIRRAVILAGVLRVSSAAMLAFFIAKKIRG